MPPDAPLPAGNLATALNIGASSVSMLVAEPQKDGSFLPLEFLEQPAPVARDIFRRGSLTPATTERIVTIIRGYQKTLAELGLNPTAIDRAVATNILSESPDHEAFQTRIRIACGIKIDIVDDGEMTRLIYLKTRRRLQQLPTLKRNTTLVVHVGPGNTRALLFEKGAITRYTSYRLGTHRTHEAVEGSHLEGPSLLRVIREQASSNLSQLRFDYHDVTIASLVVIGYEIQHVTPFLCDSAQSCPVKTLRQFTSATATLGDLGMVNRYQIDYQTAEGLLPALEINLAIAEMFKLGELHIPASEYEQGLLHDLLISRNLTGAFGEEVLRSARILAKRYQSDPRHGEHVSRLCAKLFQDLADLHQLGAHDALLLQVAAILHEVGTFVSPRAHHKHSEYIILNSEIFGLDRLDVTLVALIARYHRHSGPHTAHPSYRELTVDNRIRVCKLAALLRVADALERTHDQRVSEITLRRDDRRLHIRIPGLADTAIERIALEDKADLFETVFGLEVVIDEDR